MPDPIIELLPGSPPPRRWPRIFRVARAAIIFGESRDRHRARADHAERERDVLAVQLQRVRRLADASTDGTAYEHVPCCDGEDTCPGCWAEDILNALDGTGGAS